MNFALALFALSYFRAQAAVLAAPRSNAEPVQQASREPRRLRSSRRRIKARAAGPGARRIDQCAGIVAQARGA